MSTKSFYGMGEGSFYGGGMYSIDGDLPDIYTEKELGPSAIVSFNDGLKNKPLKECVVDIEPVQDLHGYDSPWPGGGGKNMFDIETTTQAYISANGSVVNSSHNAVSEFIELEANKEYCVSCNKAMHNIGICIFDSDKTTVLLRRDNTNVQSVAISSTGGIRYLRVWININNSAGMTKAECEKHEPQVEVGSVRTAYAPYFNICPITGWTGANIYVSPTDDPADGRTYSVTFPTEAGTVYGGTLDVTNGVLTVDRAMVDMGTLAWAYESPNSRFFSGSINTSVKKSATNVISSMYVVGNTLTTDGTMTITGGGNLYVRNTEYNDSAAFKTAMSGVQLVYELATPVTYQLTPVEIAALLGTNNIWADTGDIAIKYLAKK